MLSKKPRSQGNGHGLERIGIVVLDRSQPPYLPRLRAFVWSSRHRSELPASPAAPPAPLKLMVGQATLTALEESAI